MPWFKQALPGPGGKDRGCVVRDAGDGCAECPHGLPSSGTD